MSKEEEEEERRSRASRESKPTRCASSGGQRNYLSNALTSALFACLLINLIQVAPIQAERRFAALKLQGADRFKLVDPLLTLASEWPEPSRRASNESELSNRANGAAYEPPLIVRIFKTLGVEPIETKKDASKHEQEQQTAISLLELEKLHTLEAGDQIAAESKRIKAEDVPIEQVIPVRSTDTPIEAHRDYRDIDISLVQSANKRPPVYMSAPKQINEIAEINSPQRRMESDLNTAAGSHKSKGKKKKKKKMVVVVEKEKKKKKKKKEKEKEKHVVVEVKYKKAKTKKYKKMHKKPKKKAKKKKKKPKKKAKKKKKKHHTKKVEHHEDHGKYHEYRAVPKKGAWKFGYKRGNKKHTIERKEHGHKSHFKTEVKWKDKKGKGHHVFDYNHGDHKHHHDHHHQHAAASSKVANLDKKQPVAELVPKKQT